MDVDRVEALVRLLREQEHIQELVVDGGTWRVQARLAPGPRFAPGEPEPPAETAPARYPVRAGLVGIFRADPNPPRLGDLLEQGVRLGSIDSMGIRTAVVAGEAGRLVEVLVEDGDPVEYGQELLVLAPEPTGEETR